MLPGREDRGQAAIEPTPCAEVHQMRSLDLLGMERDGERLQSDAVRLRGWQGDEDKGGGHTE